MNQNTAAANLLRTKKEVSPVQIIFILVSILFFVVDLVMDIIVAINFFNDGSILFFTQTLLCVVVSAIIMAGFNMWWYISETGNETVSPAHWIIRILFISLLMSPVLRCLEALYYAAKSKKSTDIGKKEHYYDEMMYSSTDGSLLRLFETFMENGPQLVLQIYIFAQLQEANPNIFTTTEMWQVAKFLLAILSITATISLYFRSVRLCVERKENLSWPPFAVLFLWRIFDLTSRVIALGLFASVFPYYLILLCFIHFVVMFIWILTMKTDLCKNKIGEFIYNLVLAEIFVFSYLRPVDKESRWHCTFFYTLTFLENTALICVWYYYYSPHVHFRLLAVIMQFSLFTLAMMIMAIYYYFIHPTRGKYRKLPKIGEKSSETEMTNRNENTASENRNLNTEESTL